MDVDPREWLEVFGLAARQAGAVAGYLQAQIRLDDKGGGSPEASALTAVDLAAQEVVLLALHARFPTLAVDAEEDTPAVARFPRSGRDLAVVDPIDGTLNYANGSPDFAVMGSLLREGVYVASLLHFPVQGRTVWAIRGGGAWIDEGEGPRALRVPDLPDHVLVAGRFDRHEVLHRAGFTTSTSRCSAIDATAPAIGRGIAAIGPERPDRRWAVGFLVTTEAGGVVRIGGRDWRGEDPERFDGGPTVVAASAAVAERVMPALR